MKQTVKFVDKRSVCSFNFFCIGAIGLLLCLCGFTDLYGQAPDKALEAGTGDKIKFSFETSPLYVPKTHVSGGGNLTVTTVMAELKAAAQVSEKTNLGLGLSYEFNDYNFTPLTGFAVSDPWNKIHLVGISGRVRYAINPTWSLFVAPSGQYSGEEGAQFGRSLLYGGSAGAAYTPNPRFTIGFAVGAFYRLEDSAVFPAIIINWKITDKFQLRNPYPISAAGPAGLELAYTMGSAWELSLGGGYRSRRFRLSDSGPVPGGVGQTNALIGYLNLSRQLGKNVSMSVYGGAAFAGSIRVEDRTGERIDSTSYNTAPILGLILRTPF
jgi:hypothetical protein